MDIATTTLDLPRIGREDLPRDTVALARFLVGKTLVHDLGPERLSGRIVETEAYLADDPSCHGFNGITRRNRSLFRERGHAYVYLSYGCWPLFNISGDEEGVGSGVLVRALEPLEGVAAMRAGANGTKLRDLARGPGRLARAMRITLEHDGLDLCGDSPLWLAPAIRPEPEIGTSVRIGITKAADWKLRFFERGSSFVSGTAALNRGGD